MARVTVEDCVKAWPNAFELVIAAALRARGLSAGQPPTVAVERDKPTVVALREIAERKIDCAALLEMSVTAQRRAMPREPELEPTHGEDLFGTQMPIATDGPPLGYVGAEKRERRRPRYVRDRTEAGYAELTNAGSADDY